MSWAKFDDHFDDDPDCDIAGEIGICLFLCSITWSSRNLTDGFIPAARVKKLPGGADKAAVAALLTVRWWEQVEGGYQIRSFLKYNQSKEEVLADRERRRLITERRAEAGQRGGQKSGEARTTKNEAEASDGANADERPSKAEANSTECPSKNEAKQAFCLPETQANDEPPVSRIPESESRLPNPAAAAPPTSPPPGAEEQVAAAAVSLRLVGTDPPNDQETTTEMTMLGALLGDSLPPFTLTEAEAEARTVSRLLQDHGVNRTEADLLAANATAGSPFSFDDIRDQIAWLPHRNARNPGHWLPVYIRDGWPKPKEVAEAEQKGARQQLKKALGPSAREVAEAQEQARTEFMDGLQQHERLAIFEEADAALSRSPAARDYVKHKGKETRGYQEMLKIEVRRLVDERMQCQMAAA